MSLKILYTLCQLIKKHPFQGKWHILVGLSGAIDYIENIEKDRDKQKKEPERCRT